MRIGIGRRVVCVPLCVAAWLALSRSGVDPIVIGLAIGLVTFAAPAERGNLERASELFRLFREQPTPELARSARVGLTSALSPNEHLQQLLHPWASYLIVPLFALANAGIRTISRTAVTGCANAAEPRAVWTGSPGWPEFCAVPASATTSSAAQDASIDRVSQPQTG